MGETKILVSDGNLTAYKPGQLSQSRGLSSQSMRTKMQTDISNVPMKSVKTKSEEKYSAGLLSREMSLNNSSSEVYYGRASVAIPFGWESQPGTPKVKFPERPLPPLTPPPSYLCSPAKKYVKKQSKSNILRTVFPKLNQRKSQLLSSPAASSSLSWSSSSSSSSSPWSSSSSRSVPLSPFTPRAHGHEELSSARLSFDSRTEEVDESPVSTLCFGNLRSSNVRSRGYSARVIKLLLGESV